MQTTVALACIRHRYRLIGTIPTQVRGGRGGNAGDKRHFFFLLPALAASSSRDRSEGLNLRRSDSQLRLALKLALVVVLVFFVPSGEGFAIVLYTSAHTPEQGLLDCSGWPLSVGTCNISGGNNYFN